MTPRYPPVPATNQVPMRPPTPPDAPPSDEQPLRPPPRRRQRIPHEQFNTKIRTDLRQRLDEFVERTDSTLKDVVDAALTEYMDRRPPSPS